MLELVASLRTDAEKLNLDENSRRSLLRGFDRSANETDLRAAADLDRQIFVQVENQLRVLKRSYGAWKVVNGHGPSSDRKQGVFSSEQADVREALPGNGCEGKP